MTILGGGGAYFPDRSRLLWLGEIHGFLVPLFITCEDDVKLSSTNYMRYMVCNV